MVKVSGRRVPLRLVFRYWKPPGVLSTTLPCKDGLNILQHSPHLATYLAEVANKQAVVPIGRLDKASEGLLLLTTDPSLCARLLRPRCMRGGSPYAKEYHVTTTRRMAEEAIVRLRAGVEIKSRRSTATTRPCTVERLPVCDQCDRSTDDGTSRRLRFILTEGKNRQIRKMVGSCSHAVESLLRVGFGSASLCGLQEGGVEVMTEAELKELLELGEAVILKVSPHKRKF